MAAQQVEQLGLPLVTEPRDWAELTSEMLGMEQHAELEQRLRAHLENTPASTAAARSRKASKEVARKTGEVQLGELRKAQKELWGAAPQSRFREIRKLILKQGPADFPMTSLDAWEESDAQRTLLLERLLWAVAKAPGSYPAPLAKGGKGAAGTDSTAADPQAARTEEELDKARSEITTLQAELNRLQQVAVRVTDIGTTEAEAKRLREGTATLRLEVLRLTGQLEETEFRLAKADMSLQRADRRQQLAVTAAEEASLRQLEAVQRQLEQARSLRESTAAEHRSDLDRQTAQSNQLEQEVQRLTARLAQAEATANELGIPGYAAGENTRPRGDGASSEMPQSANAGITPITPGGTRQELGTQSKPTPGRQQQGQGAGASTADTWLVLVGTDDQGQLQGNITAWVAGPDADDTIIAVHVEDMDAVNKVSWFAQEARTAGVTLWQVGTEVAAALDTSTTEAQLKQFARGASLVLPGLGSKHWRDMMDDDSASTTGSPNEEAGDTPRGMLGSTLVARNEHGRTESSTIVAVQAGAYALEFRSSWSIPGDTKWTGPRTQWIHQQVMDELCSPQPRRRAGLGRARRAATSLSRSESLGASKTRDTLGASKPQTRTAASGGTQSALFEQLSIPRGEYKLVEKWQARIDKLNASVNGKWTMDQFATPGDVQNRMHRLREFLVGAARGADGDLSSAAVAYGTWRQLSVNREAAKLVQRWFRINEQYEAVGRANHCVGLEVGEWLDGVFQELTLVDYSHYGRTQQLSSFGLCENWRLGMAQHQTEQWVDCIRDDPMRRTWQEARRDVCGLLEATTFQKVLEKKVLPRAEVLFQRHCGQPTAHGYWKDIEGLVAGYLEGPSGIYSDWLEYKENPADYHGSYREAFQKVEWSGHRYRREPRSGRNTVGARHTELQDAGASSAGGLMVATDMMYEPMEEAQKHAMEPCEWHVQRLRSLPQNTASESELRSRMHLTCACLNTRNKYLRCTLLDGGLDAILQRERMPKGPEKDQLWKDQMAEVQNRLRRL
jgi:hypothetical protein